MIRGRRMRWRKDVETPKANDECIQHFSRKISRDQTPPPEPLA
jgi:hypothetical protein